MRGPMADWKISSRTADCSACGRTFDEGERHVSSLAIRGEELLRADACEVCFQPQVGGGELFYWFTRTRRGAKRGLEFDLPTLEQLFLHLEGRAEQRVRELRYVLCLILMRKRRLKLQRVERGADGEAMIVRRPRREEGWKVFVFDFSAERLAGLQTELSTVFEGGDPSVHPAGAAEAMPTSDPC